MVRPVYSVLMLRNETHSSTGREMPVAYTGIQRGTVWQQVTGREGGRPASRRDGTIASWPGLDFC